MSGRLPFTAQTAADRSGALMAIFMVAFAFYVGLETGIGGWMPSHLESTGLQPLAAATLTSGFSPIFPTGIVWLAKLRPDDARATSWLFPASMLGGAIIPGGIGAVIGRSGVGSAPAVLAVVAVGCLASFWLAATGSVRRAEDSQLP